MGSLEAKLRDAQGSERVGVLLELAKAFEEPNPERAIHLCNEALNLLKERPNLGQSLKALEVMTWGQIYLGRYEDAETAISRRMTLSQDRSDHRDAYIEALKDLAIVHYYRGDYEEALAEYRRLLDLQEEQGQERELADTLNNIGLIHRKRGSYEVALDYYLRALDLYEKHGSPKNIASGLNNIGVVYDAMQRDHEALTYFNRALEIKETLGDQKSMAFTINNIGFLHMSLKEYREALAFFQRALDIRLQFSEISDIAASYQNLGSTYLFLEEYDKSREFLEKALAMKGDIGDKLGIAKTEMRLGQLFLRTGEPEKALRHLERALELAETVQAREVIRDSHEILAKVHAAIGDYRAAYREYQAFKLIHDEIFNLEATRAISSLQSKFEDDRRKEEIAALRRENELKAKEVGRQRTMRNLIVVSLMAVFLLGFLLYARHMERRKLARERRLNLELRRLDRLKDEFLANTSHELRTPLNGIIGIAQSLMEGATGRLDQNTCANLGMIVSSGMRLSRLVDDILDFSKISNDHLVLQLGSVPVGALADMVLALSAPLVGTKPLKLVNDIPDDLPLARADENRLQQVLHNLVGNAIKFTHEGEVRVGAERKGDMLEIRISDTGIGIPQHKQATIFNAFEQGDGTIVRSYGGTGLGLAISRELVRLMGGGIGVESEVGKGSTFFFSLPLCTEEVSPQVEDDRREYDPSNLPVRTIIPESLPPSAQPAKLEAFAGAHILVVDDEPVNRQVLINQLSFFDCRITEAGGGQEALKLIDGTATFDLVLLDLMMPTMSGYEVCQQIRERFSQSELPIIFLTAKNRLQDLVTGFDYGGNDYLIKPVAKEELLARVRTHLALLHVNRHLEKEVRARTGELREHNRELETLNDVVQTINREVELGGLTQALVDQAVKLLPKAKRGAFLLRDLKTRTYSFTAAAGYAWEDIRSIELTEKEALARYSGHRELDSGVNLIEVDDALAGAPKFASLQKPKAMLAMAITLEDELPEGFLILDSYHETETFDHRDLARIQRFREHAITAVSKARRVQMLLETTRRLRDTQRQLIEAAHQAGMAEIAISVLHNIGNSLNSIKASVSVMHQRTMDARPTRVIRGMAKLLEENQTKLGPFFEESESQGAKLIVALERIASLLDENTLKLGHEVGLVRDYVNQIQEIIAAQEEYAQVPGLVETVDINQLIAEVIQMEMSHLDEAGIEVQSRFEPLPEFPIQRFKMITMLNHLIRNAAEAISARDGVAPGLLIISTRSTEDGGFEIEIRDNGIGIAEDLLEIIFRRGYTTKPRARGFGLHFAANVVADMGGRLWAESNGVGSGASLRVRLPAYQAEPNHQLVG
ncbi:ATP-binding protein [Sulfidibacter corallicola]|uniref:histidine kinase n=1 Tax=Sulfidibacter corallicola TaxID=2818388 RepID=A0A8A4TFS3_SULCO|nr:ATP-binding protein [Sulfidibacter corallicola]QTD48483.1 tetratricopeptide repeat protein [Sulfidibacter corallicola]